MTTLQFNVGDTSPTLPPAQYSLVHCALPRHNHRLIYETQWARPWERRCSLPPTSHHKSLTELISLIIISIFYPNQTGWLPTRRNVFQNHHKSLYNPHLKVIFICISTFSNSNKVVSNNKYCVLTSHHIYNYTEIAPYTFTQLIFLIIFIFSNTNRMIRNNWELVVAASVTPQCITDIVLSVYMIQRGDFH